jgi:hypothetical protein
VHLCDFEGTAELVSLLGVGGVGRFSRVMRT